MVCHSDEFCIALFGGPVVAAISWSAAADVAFPGDLESPNNHGNLDFFGSGASATAGGERFLQFLVVFACAGSGAAMVTGIGKRKEVVDRLEIWRVGTEKREIARNILEGSNEIPMHSTPH